METSRHVVMLVVVTLAGTVVAGQGQSRTDAEAVNLIGQKSELSGRAQGFDVDLAGINARQKALQEQIAMIRSEASKGSAGGGQLDEFTRDLNRLAGSLQNSPRS